MCGESDGVPETGTSRGEGGKWWLEINRGHARLIRDKSQIIQGTFPYSTVVEACDFACRNRPELFGLFSGLFVHTHAFRWFVSRTHPIQHTFLEPPLFDMRIGPLHFGRFATYLLACV